MWVAACMQTLVVTMSVCQDCAAIRRGISKYVWIVGPTPSRLLDGEHVMSPVAQNFHRAQWESSSA